MIVTPLRAGRGRYTSILAAVGRAEVFLIYLDKLTWPALRAGQVVIMDNLSVHKN